MDMNLQKYIAFAKASEHGSFTKAADMLNYSQSGISRMINDLEKEWGISLLERSKGGVKLTAEGIKLLPFVKETIKNFERLQTEIDAINGLQRGLIRIGTFSSVAIHWLPNIIKKFKIDYPNVEYKILFGDYSEIEQWILTGYVDCGFTKLPTTPDLDTIFLEQDQFMVVLPCKHLFFQQNKISIAAICDEPFILLEKNSKSEVSEIFKRCGLAPNVLFSTGDYHTIMSMVESGLGISILPELVLRRNPYNIVAKKLSFPEYRSIGLALKDKNNCSPLVKKFLEYLVYR